MTPDEIETALPILLRRVYRSLATIAGFLESQSDESIRGPGRMLKELADELQPFPEELDRIYADRRKARDKRRLGQILSAIRRRNKRRK